MSAVIVTNSITLDGVMQAPGRPDEDRRGGFDHGGWAAPYADPVMGEIMGRGIASGGALLFGRRTYEDFAEFWPRQPEDNPFTTVLNDFQKYVVSTQLRAPLPWHNSTVISGDPVQAIAELKGRPGKDLVILGSGRLIRSLLPHGLIDEFVLSIHPLVLGSGTRLFADDGTMAALELIESTQTTTGVIVARYRPAPTS